MSLVLRDVRSGAAMGSSTDVQRSIKSLDCFGSSHFIGFTDAWGYISHSACYYCCLIKFFILYKTLTWKIRFGVVAGVGRWPASILLWVTMDSGLRIKPCHFKIGVTGSVNPFTLPE